jgi:hypothetical protein
MARYGREIGMYQDGKEKPANPLPKDHPNYAKAQEMIDSGKFAVTKGAIVDGKQQYNFKKIETEDPQFKAEKEAQLAKEKISGQNQMGIGSVSIYNDELTDQERAIQENSKGIYQYGRLSQGNRPELQNKTGSAFGSEDIKTPESKADFMDRWGDVVATISGFDYDKEPDDPQWGEFQKKAEETRKKEHIAAFGSDKGYIPYWKEKGSKGYVSGQAFDSKLGLHTYNAPRFKLGEVEPGDATFSVDVPPDPRDPLQAPGVQNYKQPEGQWWAQDINNLNALSLVDDNLYLPWAPDMNPAKIDYVLDDWRGAANANSAAANTMANALGAVGGPQAVANSNIQGQAMDANAQAINRVNTNNVGIMNQVAPMQAQLNMKVDEINQGRNMNVYDNTQKTLQNADNFKNWKIGKEAELFNTALTNRANTYNLNSTYDYYAIDPTTGGPIYYKNGKALQKAPVTDQASLKKAYFDNVAEYAKNIGRTPSEKELEGYFKYIGGINNTPDISNAQLEMKTRGNPQGYVQGKSGKEIKRMIVPFYTGKMGS